MATTYKTPGVYVEEIPKFPPSVAPVDTAIPAFIGYTEKAIDEVADDLLLKPKRIESLVEFEQYFGRPQLETEIAVDDHRDHRGDPGHTSVVDRRARRGRPLEAHPLLRAAAVLRQRRRKRATSSRSASYKAIGTALDARRPPGRARPR